jgi:hypothetical protein
MAYDFVPMMLERVHPRQPTKKGFFVTPNPNQEVRK